MAPEVVSGERHIDGRADLYSLACTAYWAVTGQLVFEASTPMQMLLHQVQTPPVPPSQISELPIPKAFDTILMTCLEKSPANRFSSAIELDAQLDDVATAQRWTQEKASVWWQIHVPELLAQARVQPARVKYGEETRE